MLQSQLPGAVLPKQTPIPDVLRTIRTDRCPVWFIVDGSVGPAIVALAAGTARRKPHGPPGSLAGVRFVFGYGTSGAPMHAPCAVAWL